MLTSNPFRDRTFSGATSNTNSISSGYQRHYFPVRPQKIAMKPGFLATSMSSLPTVSCDLKSPYSSLNYKKQERQVRKQYIQNPFYKSSLLEDSYSSLYSSSVSNASMYNYTSIPKYLYTTSLQEQKITPLYVNNYQDKTNNKKFIKKQSKQQFYQPQYRQTKLNPKPYQTLNNKNKDNDNYYKPNIAQAAITQSKKLLGIKRINSDPTFTQVHQVQKIENKNFNSNSIYQPLNQQIQEYPPFNKIQTNNYQRIDRVNQSKYQEHQEYPRKFPSFNSKQFNRYDERQQSPKFRTKNFNTQNYYSPELPKFETSNIQTRTTRNAGVGGQGNGPKTVNFQGKTYYQVNIESF